ncbi:MAG: S-adenosylmethionine decarboxylase family protein [Dehalococcoidia bacterium]
MHLIIDGYSNDKRIIRDEDFLRNWLETYPAQIGMTRISPPYVLRYVGPVLDDWGISGFVFIAESHIGVHTFVERNYVNIDIFSCKDFDTEKAIRDFQEGFQLVKLRTCLIDREWPQTESVTTNPQSFVYHE